MRIQPFERLRFIPPPEPGHAPSRSFGAVFRYRSARAFAAWPNEWSFPHRSAALMGFCPSQVCSRIGWVCISAHPGPPAVRAARPPRLIFVGVITPARWHLHRTRKGEWVWGLRRSTSGLRSRLRSAPAVIVATGRDPALGFASCRVRGHAIRASARARPRLADHQPPALADHFGKSSQSAHGLWAILPGSSARRWLPPFCAKPVTALTATSPALQRVEGTDAWLVRTFVRIRSLFEVLHRP